MCGIFGEVGNTRRDGLVPFLRLMSYRGPDDEQWHEERGFTVGHVRLAIVDVQRGRQPVYGWKKTGVAYNGEIYNHNSFRDELERGLHYLNSNCDTEILPHLFEEYGSSAYAKLDGMFSFALWTKDEVHLVRDKLGIKPLYYAFTSDGGIRFSSELKPLAISLDKVTLDMEGIHSYFTFRYIPPPRTIFKEIRKVRPGHFIRINRKTRALVELSFCHTVAIDPPTAIQVRERVIESVKAQLMGEVPIALLLSGGLDSSALALALRELNAPLTCYSIAFEEADEIPFAEIVAQRFGLPHKTMRMKASFVDIDDLVRELDEPLADPAVIPLARIADEIKKDGVKVVLSGEGADELYGGYWSHRNISGEADFKEIETFMNASAYWTRASEYLPQGFYSVEDPAAHFALSDSLSGYKQWDLGTWLGENLMAKADRTLMKRSIEGRFPYLSLDLVRSAASIPSGALMSGEGKAILREAFKDLPSEVLTRAKQGFTVPIGNIMDMQKDRVVEDVSKDFPELGRMVRGILNGGKEISDVEHPVWRAWSAWTLARWLGSQEYRIDKNI